MTPTHANKNGVRYRYYVSHAILQKQDAQAGSVPRAAPEIEALIVKTLRDRLGPIADDADPKLAADRELIAPHRTRRAAAPAASFACAASNRSRSTMASCSPTWTPPR